MSKRPESNNIDGIARALTAAEILEHPEFESVNWDLKPVKKGKATAAIERGGPIQIAYELHGHGETCLVVCPPKLAFTQFGKYSEYSFRLRILM